MSSRAVGVRAHLRLFAPGAAGSPTGLRPGKDGCDRRSELARAKYHGVFRTRTIARMTVRSSVWSARAISHVRQPRLTSTQAAIQEAAGPVGERRRAAVTMRSTTCSGGTHV